MLVGMVSLSFSAKYYGVSLEKDTWLLAISIIVFLDLAIWGAINETFRSKFIFMREELGEYEALNKTKSLIFFIFFFSVLISIIVFLFPGFLGQIIAPKYDDNQLNGLVHMILIATPILLINQITAIGTSILNAYDSFFIPEISGFVSAIINLLLLIVLAPIIGIYALVISYYIGVLLLFGLIYTQVYKLQINLFSGYKNIKFDDFLIFLIFALPFFFPYLLSQIFGILEKTLASSIGIGYVSILDYSRRFSSIIQGILSSVLVTILVPVLSKNYIEKKVIEFESNFLQIFQLGLLFLTFVIGVFTSSSSSLVNVFFDRGTISKTALQEISELMIFYIWSNLALFIYIIFGMVLLSTGAVKKYAFWGVVAQIISIALIFIFIKNAGVYIFPISLFASHLFAGLVMFWFFPYKSKLFYRISFKYLCILLFTVLAVFFIDKSLFRFSNAIISIGVNSFLTLVILLLMIVLFKLEEKKHIENFIKKVRKMCQWF